ncbi:MAG: flagellar motor protein MotB [Sphingomonadales bacterium]|nr:flagellar motor protein MotB [Sphingomonadales bacterium]
MRVTLLVGCWLLFFFSATTNAQGYRPEKVSKKAAQLYEKAYEKAATGNNKEAIDLLQQATDADENYADAWIALAKLQAESKNYSYGLICYRRALSIDVEYFKPFLLSYAIALAGTGDFNKALEITNRYIDQYKPTGKTLEAALLRKKNFEFAVQQEKLAAAANEKTVFSPKNLGATVNSKMSEYLPSQTIDGKQLYFTRRVDTYNEDFFTSSGSKTGSWETSSAVKGSLNTPQSEGAMMISQDGEWLVFTGCYRADSYGGCDLYISYRTPAGWSAAINLGANVNSDQWESQPCLSPDKQELYFASRRLGGYGGSDLYVCKRQENGTWSAPVNLGPSVNSPSDEQCPFIHADNQTLYFTSSYWPGYGDDDIFFVRKLGDGSWSQPTNLGYPINTIDREGTLFITADGKTALYAAERKDSYGLLDLYSFELKEKNRPYPTRYVQGKVTDKKTGKGVEATLELTDLSTRQIITKVKTDSSGQYLLTLPSGRDYAFTVNQRGYLFNSDQYFLKNGVADSAAQKNIVLQPIEKNAAIVLKNIFFETNRFELNPTSQTELDKLVTLLLENPTIKIEIGGHTDNVGKAADNLALSDHRAKAVVDYLLAKKIDSARLSSTGYGMTQPVADNSTAEGRAQNRRTEMKITGL